MLYHFNRGLLHLDALFHTLPDIVELSSVCVRPPGATSSRLGGPSEKVRFRTVQLMLNRGGHHAMD